MNLRVSKPREESYLDDILAGEGLGLPFDLAPAFPSSGRDLVLAFGLTRVFLLDLEDICIVYHQPV